MRFLFYCILVILHQFQTNNAWFVGYLIMEINACDVYIKLKEWADPL